METLPRSRPAWEVNFLCCYAAEERQAWLLGHEGMERVVSGHRWPCSSQIGSALACNPILFSTGSVEFIATVGECTSLCGYLGGLVLWLPLRSMLTVVYVRSWGGGKCLALSEFPPQPVSTPLQGPPFPLGSSVVTRNS